jgi:hypothetical protein
MIKSILRQFTNRMPDLEVGEPTMLLSNFMNGVLSLKGSWRKRTTSACAG